MSTADREQVREQVRVEDEDANQDENHNQDREDREDESEGAPPGGTAPGGETAGYEAAPERDASEQETGAEDRGERRLTPRQARRLRIVLSSVGMAVMAVVLWMRIASRSSVLVVGVYGLALILCGVVMELSRNGRTRLASWLLGIGLLAAVGTDWLLLP
ncbi:hypothetical protein OHT52_00440 [Streptomyces sp. NBC_00247]|uniref:hypothetical protein n=1 Tax=Streptomyces sp. NBC_00247 TaxID=2975689 RepID=UPI002E2B7B27|nr:hypothetical protein [Streptomyces sp. NBC_00247]